MTIGVTFYRIPLGEGRPFTGTGPFRVHVHEGRVRERGAGLNVCLFGIDFGVSLWLRETAA